VNIRKGANVFILSISMLVCGAIFATANLVNSHIENSTSTALQVAHVFTWQFGMIGTMMFVVGGVWLIFSFVGSFFTFDTSDLIQKVWTLAVVTIVVTVVYIFGIALSGIQVLKHPWTINVMIALVVLAYLQVSLNFFFYAAREE